MSIQKEQIEDKVTHKDILDHFLRPYYHGRDIKQGVLISNPLLATKQDTPSFNVYSKGGAWRWKDFTGMDGSAFDLVMLMYGVEFPKALDIINQEMNLLIDSNFHETIPQRLIKKPEIEIIEERNYNYDMDIIDWTEDLHRFWKLYGISQEVLETYKVKPLRAFFAYNKSNESYYVEATEREPIYAYMHEGWAKIYRPYSAPMKFLYIGQKPDYFVFGFHNLPEKGDNFYLVGGEKDVITMASHGMSSCCLNSEESSPINYPKLLELFKSLRFKNHYIMYDNDTTGVRQMNKISEEFPILKIKQVPEMEFGNDISDYYKNKYSNRLSK